MKTEEELFVDFVNEYHSDEAIDIMLDPLLYIYYRDSTGFACYRARCVLLDLKHVIDVVFKISILLNGCARFINKILRRKNNGN